MLYSGFFLFGANPNMNPFQLDSFPVAVFLIVFSILVPVAGNIWPDRVSFLLAMRYYAGNWAASVWLFKGDSYRKLDRLTKAAPWVNDQVVRMYGEALTVGYLGKVIAFRLMHLHGRAFHKLLPKAVARAEDYEWVEGELVAGTALGWNFGDGHMHNGQLITAMQQRCGFESGELRVILLDAQPIHKQTQEYRLVDAATGEFERGYVRVADMVTRQPWADDVPVHVFGSDAAGSRI